MKSRLVGPMASATFAAALIAFVGKWEGLRLEAYYDIVGVPTICYGETHNVRMGQKATLAECNATLMKSLIKHEAPLLKCVKPDIVPEGVQFSLIELSYNVGPGKVCASRAVERANARDWNGACRSMTAFNKAGGRIVRGLVNRRSEAHQICSTMGRSA